MLTNQIQLANDPYAQQPLVTLLAEYERRFRIFSEASVQGKMVLRAYRPLWANALAAKLLGYADAEVMARRLSVLNHFDDATQADPEQAEARAMGRLEETRARWTRSDGAPMDVAFVSRPLIWAGGPALLIAFKDITDLTKAEADAAAATQRARNAWKARNALLSAVSHHLRTPLHCLMGRLSLAMAEPQTAAQRQQLLGASHDARRMLVQIDDILDLSAVETGAAHLRREPFDLADAVDDALQNNQGGPCDVRMRLHVDAPMPGQVIVAGDRRRLSRVVLALIEEAGRGGADSLTLRVRSDGKAVEAVVTARHATLPNAPMGEQSVLDGFHLAQAMAGALGGAVERIEHPRPALRARLPFPRVQTAVGPVVVAPYRPSRSLRVLAVDDHASNRALIEALLLSLDHRVVSVDSGAAALAALASAEAGFTPRFDLLLTDLMMPEMSGVDLARQVRARDGTHRDIPIVALTADVSDAARIAAEEAGMDAFLTKPLKPAALIEALTLLSQGSIDAAEVDHVESEDYEQEGYDHRDSQHCANS